MSIRRTTGRALIAGSPVADVVLIEERVEDFVRVPGASGLKDLSYDNQPLLTFVDIFDQAVRQRLEQLVTGARDVEFARRLRDQGADRVVVDVVLDDSRQLIGCSIAAPINYLGALETLQFLAALPDPA